VTVGTTSFTSIGAASNTVGVIFTATGVGSGTGTALQSELKNQAQTDAMQGHMHGINWTANYDNGQANVAANGTSGGFSYRTNIMNAGLYADGSNGTPRTAGETRPINLSCNRIIKY
jgi:hypothetical protein